MLTLRRSEEINLVTLFSIPTSQKNFNYQKLNPCGLLIRALVKKTPIAFKGSRDEIKKGRIQVFDPTSTYEKHAL